MKKAFKKAYQESDRLGQPSLPHIDGFIAVLSASILDERNIFTFPALCHMLIERWGNEAKNAVKNSIWKHLSPYSEIPQKMIAALESNDFDSSHASLKHRDAIRHFQWIASDGDDLFDEQYITTVISMLNNVVFKDMMWKRIRDDVVEMLQSKLGNGDFA